MSKPKRTRRKPKARWVWDRWFVYTAIAAWLIQFASSPFNYTLDSHGRLLRTTNEPAEMGVGLCGLAFAIALDSLILRGIWRGKKWAFWVRVLFGTCGCGVLSWAASTPLVRALGDVPKVEMIPIIIGLVLALLEYLYCCGRVLGMGPKLK